MCYRFVFHCAFFGALSALTACGKNGPNCRLELAVYDPVGNRLDFRLVSVSRPDSEINLLSIPEYRDGVRASGNHLQFAEKAIGQLLKVVLVGDKGHRLSETVFITSCRQRVSLRFGEMTSEIDAVGSTVRGRLRGCDFARGDWWIRAMPMYGRRAGQMTLDGFVANDGSFSLEGDLRGERHILVVGAGKSVINAFPVNVTHNDVTDAGTITITGACPSEAPIRPKL